jgi:hypothetical protein
MAQIAPWGNIWRESSDGVREVLEVLEVRRNSASTVAILPMPCAAFLVETPAQFESKIRPRLKMRLWHFFFQPSSFFSWFSLDCGEPYYLPPLQLPREIALAASCP